MRPVLQGVRLLSPSRSPWTILCIWPGTAELAEPAQAEETAVQFLSLERVFNLGLLGGLTYSEAQGIIPPPTDDLL